ncbi:flagellin N-terminal helical domain-containing protein [Alsobacter sp. SYSU BS001988]|jgi:flagellin-like hook-associated protein FlgL
MAISLSDSMRSSLVALTSINDDMSVSQTRLATGKKINTAADNAAVYFQAKSLTDRAASLEVNNSAMSLGLKTIAAGVEGLTNIKKIMSAQLSSMQNAKTGSNDERKAVADAFRTMLGQINGYVNDADVLGQGNLLKGNKLTLKMNDDGSSTQDVKLSAAVDATTLGFDYTAATGVSTDATNNFQDTAAGNTELDDAITLMSAALSKVNTSALSLGYQNSVINSRMDFNKTLLSALKDGADSLTAADISEEAAKVGAAQTRQSFVMNGLSITKQSEQNLLQLMR